MNLKEKEDRKIALFLMKIKLKLTKKNPHSSIYHKLALKI